MPISSTHGLALTHLLLLSPLLLACDDAARTDDTSDTADTADTSDTNNGDGDGDLDELSEPTLPPALLDYDHALPAHFTTPFVIGSDNTPADNPTTDAGATLGRVLFWDRRLSQNGTVACGSCHRPDAGFSDDVALSEGFAGELTGRNSMSLLNVRFYARGAMFWDERADTLEDQVLRPIQDAAEMGLTLEELVVRVEDADYYAPLFEDAFGDSEVTTERISFALAQFVRSIASYQSAWDEGVQLVGGEVDQDFPNYTTEQNRGKDLFFGQARCATCHMPANPLTPPPPGGAGGPTDNLALWYVNEPVNNGLFDDDDDGYGETTGQPQDAGKFKSPSLRNISLTAPYMHDGRFTSLLEVVEHYDSGVENHPNLDPRLRNPQTQMPQQLGLSAGDRSALVAFLETLEDPTLAVDPRWADPFVD
jgi:cytochrome c peroxidase